MTLLSKYQYLPSKLPYKYYTRLLQIGPASSFSVSSVNRPWTNHLYKLHIHNMQNTNCLFLTGLRPKLTTTCWRITAMRTSSCWRFGRSLRQRRNSMTLRSSNFRTTSHCRLATLSPIEPQPHSSLTPSDQFVHCLKSPLQCEPTRTPYVSLWLFSDVSCINKISLLIYISLFFLCK